MTVLRGAIGFSSPALWRAGGNFWMHDHFLAQKFLFKDGEVL
jgi:hypothetical protein